MNGRLRPPTLRRREFLRRALAAPALAAPSLAAGARALGGPPAIVSAQGRRPEITHGVASGDVTGGRAIVWSRVDRPARMVVEWDTTDAFREAKRVAGPAASALTGFTARVELTGLPPGQRISYRVFFEDLEDPRAVSLPVTGTLRTAATEPASVSLAWSADTVGQGWGINPEWGGLRLYDVMRRAAPDVFVHCGDTVYADGPLLPEVTLDDGTIWRNVVTPAKSKVAETLEEFRGNHLYNLTDLHLQRFNREVPVVALWDDHEVLDNWYPTEVLAAGARHSVKDVSLLAARGKQAFFEHFPIRAHPDEARRIYRALSYGPSLDVFALDMRSYRGANSPGRQTARGAETALLGETQRAWLEAALRSSRATWKVVASDMPLGLVVRDFPDHFEAVANGHPGPPLGRELEIAALLASLKRDGVRNVVWITGDVHYAAAHHYDPARAGFAGFDPFWEFVAGPIHAGTFGPNALDDTFGPEVRFSAIPEGMKPNRPPSDGLQFFGMLKVDGRTRVLTATLHDLSGRTLFSQDLTPQR
ncbi:MAG TPA: alkaline phosphatase D family protein [Vicinamibacteria bacterium]|nr:alkaline phosphatase D family protein [Vicinamibacteria bacterium]